MRKKLRKLWGRRAGLDNIKQSMHPSLLYLLRRACLPVFTPTLVFNDLWSSTDVGFLSHYQPWYSWILSVNGLSAICCQATYSLPIFSLFLHKSLTHNSWYTSYHVRTMRMTHICYLVGKMYAWNLRWHKHEYYPRFFVSELFAPVNLMRACCSKRDSLLSKRNYKGVVFL